MIEDEEELDENNDDYYCLSCEAELLDPCDDDAIDKADSDPANYGIRAESPYSWLCCGCATPHVRDDERYAERSKEKKKES